MSNKDYDDQYLTYLLGLRGRVDQLIAERERELTFNSANLLTRDGGSDIRNLSVIPILAWE